MKLTKNISKPDITTKTFVTNERYGIEFFHIYTDENISERHTKSLEYMSVLQNTRPFGFTKIVLIDNYNPDQQIIKGEEIIAYLDSKSMRPDYFAYEKDLINNSAIFLESITDARTRKSYTRYIKNHNKYPCSLLTVSWYLTRLGYLDFTQVIQNSKGVNKPFVASTRLINILPDDYKANEKLARQLILNSSYSSAADKIENIFYSV